MPNDSEVLKELKRELTMRHKLYPKWVLSGKLSQATAEHRIGCLSIAISRFESSSRQGLLDL